MTETKMNLKLSKGEVVVLTEGEYSNYGITGFIVALKDLDLGEQARTFVEETGQTDYYTQTEGFLPWLIAKELVVPVAYREVFLGAYSNFDDDFGVKATND